MGEPHQPVVSRGFRGRPPAEPYLLVVASRRRGSGPAMRLLGEARRGAGCEELVLEPLDDDRVRAPAGRAEPSPTAW